MELHIPTLAPETLFNIGGLPITNTIITTPMITPITSKYDGEGTAGSKIKINIQESKIYGMGINVIFHQRSADAL